MNPQEELALRVAWRVKAGVRCEVPACHDFVFRVGRYCRLHAKRAEAHGCPIGTAVTKRELAPFVKEAAAFIAAQEEHVGIVAATDWLQAKLNSGADVIPYRRHYKLSPGERLRAWFAQMKTDGVQAADVLAVITAIYLLREDQPRRFKSDQHFNAQIAVRVLRLLPGRYRHRANKGAGATCADRITPGTRELLAGAINTQIGVVVQRAAIHIHTHRKPEATTRKPRGQNDPFITSETRP